MTIPELVSRYFVKIQMIVFIAGIFIGIRLLRSNQGRSQFRTREADRNDLNQLREGPGLADAKLNAPRSKNPPPPPLSLPGIRLSGEAHEILGIDETATEVEVMRAYKDAIKRFHPDTIQGEAKSQIKFYQEASAKLNQAKEDMLKSIRARTG